MRSCGLSPAGPCSNVVDRWIGGAIDPGEGSRSAPACTASVSSLMKVTSSIVMGRSAAARGRSAPHIPSSHRILGISLPGHILAGCVATGYKWAESPVPAGGGPMSPIPVASPDPTVEAYLRLSTCNISDALDRLHLQGAPAGILPLWPGCRKIAGRAMTMRLVPQGPVSAVHGTLRAITEARPGDIMVIDHEGRLDDVLRTAQECLADEERIRDWIASGVDPVEAHERVHYDRTADAGPAPGR